MILSVLKLTWVIVTRCYLYKHVNDELVSTVWCEGGDRAYFAGKTRDCSGISISCIR